VDRRKFVGAALGSLVAAPLSAGAQQTARVYRLGILGPGPRLPSDRMSLSNRVSTALRDLGYVEGQTLALEIRLSEGNPDRLPGLARELVQLRVDVIFAIGTLSLRAAKDATTTIPIVMFNQLDPVAAGFVRSLARPGGNITGVLIAAEGTLAAKRLGLLKEAVPRAARIALLSLDETGARAQVEEARKAAPSLGVELIVVEVQDGDYDRAFATIAAERAAALFVLAHPYFANAQGRTRIIELAAKYRLPAIYEWREHVEDGGLMAYGGIQSELARHVAVYVARIFKGAKPADLPIEQATRFELSINLKTATALGFTFPPSILARTDRVIQ
jgi:putative ABC transport system substrate-binding protein